jgi:hypothetical protein
MGDATVNPVYIALLCIARCLIPLLILFDFLSVLRRLGVSKPAPPPEEYQSSEDNGYWEDRHMFKHS